MLSFYMYGELFVEKKRKVATSQNQKQPPSNRRNHNINDGNQ